MEIRPISPSPRGTISYHFAPDNCLEFHFNLNDSFLQKSNCIGIKQLSKASYNPFSILNVHANKLKRALVCWASTIIVIWFPVLWRAFLILWSELSPYFSTTPWMNIHGTLYRHAPELEHLHLKLTHLSLVPAFLLSSRNHRWPYIC